MLKFLKYLNDNIKLYLDVGEEYKISELYIEKIFKINKKFYNFFIIIRIFLPGTSQNDVMYREMQEYPKIWKVENSFLRWIYFFMKWNNSIMKYN